MQKRGYSSSHYCLKDTGINLICSRKFEAMKGSQCWYTVFHLLSRSILNYVFPVLYPGLYLLQILPSSNPGPSDWAASVQGDNRERLSCHICWPVHNASMYEALGIKDITVPSADPWSASFHRSSYHSRSPGK